MLERDIEAHLVKRCNEIGALCDKFTSPAHRNVPDRIITYRRIVIFLELKAPGRKPTAAQTRDHLRRVDAGATVVWTDSRDGVDVVIECLRTRTPIPYLATIDGGAPYKVKT